MSAWSLAIQAADRAAAAGRMQAVMGFLGRRLFAALEHEPALSPAAKASVDRALAALREVTGELAQDERLQRETARGWQVACDALTRPAQQQRTGTDR